MNVIEANPLVRVLAGLFFLPLSITLLAGDVVTVRPTEIEEALVNPGVGFMTFQRFNGDSLNAGLKVRFVKPCEFGVRVPRVWAEQSAQNSK